MRLGHVTTRALLVCLVAGSLPACHGSLPLTPQVSALGAQSIVDPYNSHGKIQHVVIIVQENRSFNNLFYGYPKATTASYGYSSTGEKIDVQPVPLETTWNIRHDATAFFQGCNGTGKMPGTDCRMNGFNLEYVGCGGRGEPRCPVKYPQYSYVPHSETQPYFDMASQYVLADEMFPSNMDTSSFVSHQYLIAGQAQSAINYPQTSWGCPGGKNDKVSKVSHYRKFPDGNETPCWDPKTLGDELDDAGFSWAFYASTYDHDGGIWSSYQAVKHIYYGKDWKDDVVSPSSQFITDVKAGKLRNVTWITPTYQNSDHPGSGSKTGPSWVASLVNAVGESKFWNSTAIFIMWDENGGLFDPVPPKFVDYDGLGIRVPLLIISPYAKRGLVSHTHFETGSILRYVEEQFHLAQMAPSDTRATSPGFDCFDYKGPPRRFVKINAPFDERYFLTQPPDFRPPDDN